VGEVDEADDAEHEREPGRHHGVERAQGEAVQRLLEEVVQTGPPRD
jgi:hypothetical protein